MPNQVNTWRSLHPSPLRRQPLVLVDRHTWSGFGLGSALGLGVNPHPNPHLHPPVTLTPTLAPRARRKARPHPHPHPSPNPHPKAFIWPSGYYAKTEFNITFDRNNNAELTGGRDQHLVTIDALLEVIGFRV